MTSLTCVRQMLLLDVTIPESSIDARVCACVHVLGLQWKFDLRQKFCTELYMYSGLQLAARYVQWKKDLRARTLSISWVNLGVEITCFKRLQAAETESSWRQLIIHHDFWSNDCMALENQHLTLVVCVQVSVIRTRKTAPEKFGRKNYTICRSSLQNRQTKL